MEEMGEGEGCFLRQIHQIGPETRGYIFVIEHCMNWHFSEFV
jgi:hypothetical protein